MRFTWVNLPTGAQLNNELLAGRLDIVSMADFTEFVRSPDAGRHIGSSLIRIFSGFGIGAILAFYPILLSTIHGVKGIDRRLLNAAQSLGAGRWEIFWEVILPGAFPSIVTGLSIGMGTCWFSLITAR